MESSNPVPSASSMKGNVLPPAASSAALSVNPCCLTSASTPLWASAMWTCHDHGLRAIPPVVTSSNRTGL